MTAKRTYFLLGLGALIVLALGFWLASTNQPEEIVDSGLFPVNVGYNAQSIGNVSIILAQEMGYFEDHGLSVQLLPLKSGSEVRQALVSGQVDLGLAGFTNFLNVMSQGAPLRVITTTIASPSYVFVRPDGELRNLSDLVGHDVVAGGTTNLSLRQALKEQGVDPSKVTISNLDRSYQVTALMDKKAVGAVLVSEQGVTDMVAAGAIILPEWDEKGYADRYMPRNSLVVNTDFLNQHEAEVRGFLAAMVDSQRLIRDNPDEAARLLCDHIRQVSGGALDYRPEDIVQTWRNGDISNMVWQDPTVAMGLADMAFETELIDHPLTMDEIFDLRFETELSAWQNEIYGAVD
ncbi:MAG: ABC transporter substrate-binding protein [bacterium]